MKTFTQEELTLIGIAAAVVVALVVGLIIALSRRRRESLKEGWYIVPIIEEVNNYYLDYKHAWYVGGKQPSVGIYQASRRWDGHAWIEPTWEKIIRPEED